MSAVLIHAQSDMVLYGGVLKYADSSKDNGWFAGAYFQESSAEDRLELAYERTEVDYIDVDTSALKQNDFTAIWTHYLSSDYSIRLGGHYIDSSDTLSDGAYSLFAGIKYFEGYAFDMGVDGYYSTYDDYLSSDEVTKGLDVIQIEASIGFTFGQYDSSIGSFYSKFSYDLIRPDNEGLTQLSDSYHSAALSLKNFNGNWTTTVAGWVGKQVFAMRNEGFVMYNLNEEHRGGAEFSVHYAFSDHSGLKVQYGYERFKEPEFSKASSTALSGFLNHRF